MKNVTVLRIIRKIGKYIWFYLSDPRNLFEFETIAQTTDGVRFCCLRENLIERSILDFGQWEPAETAIVKKCIGPGSVVFDIGANIGYFSLLMSKCVGQNGEVHCFEPTSYGFRRLKGNVALNANLPVQNLRLNNLALSSSCGNAIEAFEARFSSKVLAFAEAERVELLTLDFYFFSSGLSRIEFIKIDVDGYDYEVIKGAEVVLRKYRPIVMAEICDRVLRQRGVDAKTYLGLYLKFGYTSCEIFGGVSEIVALDKLIKDPRVSGASWNVLLT